MRKLGPSLAWSTSTLSRERSTSANPTEREQTEQTEQGVRTLALGWIDRRAAFGFAGFVPGIAPVAGKGRPLELDRGLELADPRADSGLLVARLDRLLGADVVDAESPGQLPIERELASLERPLDRDARDAPSLTVAGDRDDVGR